MEPRSVLVCLDESSRGPKQVTRWSTSSGRSSNGRADLGPPPVLALLRDIDISYDQCYELVMKQIPAAKFKEHCLALLDEVDPDCIVITKRGKPVAKLIPISTGSASLIGSLRGKLEIRGDIRSTGARWHVES